MADTVNVPGLGATNKYFVYGGLGVVGVLAVMYFRNHKANAATSSTALSAPSGGTGDQFPSDGTTGNPNDPYSIDPLTGITYGDESQSGGIGGGGGGFFNVGQTTYPSTTTFTNNAQWSQYAENFLTGSSGMQPGTVSNALGAYITGHSVTAAQEAIINDAIAFAGYPPVAGPGNFPPSIRVQGSKQGGKTYAENPVKGLKVTVTGAGINQPAHAKPVKLPPVHLEATWDESQHASSYKVTLREKGRLIHSGSTHNRKFTFANVKRGAEYTIEVLANPAKPGTRPASINKKV